MTKQELIKKCREIVLKTNGGNDDYVVALCQIANAISELDEPDKQIAELKQQLEEKDKKIEEVNKFIALFDCDNFDEFKSFISFCRLTPHEQETLILNLQKQLHTQPKEIVEKIRAVCEKEKEDNDLAWLGFKKLNRILNEILKEYGGNI